MSDNQNYKTFQKLKKGDIFGELGFLTNLKR